LLAAGREVRDGDGQFRIDHMSAFVVLDMKYQATPRQTAQASSKQDAARKAGSAEQR
jgi:hypothetical protein